MDIQSIKQRFSIIGNAPDLNRAIDIAVQVAPTDLSVLITGESGVGKENFPHIIHQFSQRKHGQYIAVNCGAIPEGTIDSELFGHEKGSFTGALTDRKGYFEVSDGGTIFLDEVGELPLSTQARLLRVLESGEFLRVGSSKIQKTNVRIVAATNLNLVDAIRNGKFREDLYYRLNTVPIFIPPLRDRGDDIIRIFRKFASDFAEKYSMPVLQLTDEAKNVLLSYRWPGNVRQLKNITEQISIIEQQRTISAEVFKTYLPDYSMEKYPTLYSKNKESDRSFNNEREILYQVLFDMKKDMNDLKLLVNDLMKKNGQTMHPDFINTASDFDKIANIIKPEEKQDKAVSRNDTPEQNIQDTEEYFEDTYSLEELEKEAIKKALERNGGKRKAAAKELDISERTLYRKIKEYNLE